MAATTYTVAGSTRAQDSGNGSRGSASPGHSCLAVIDQDGRYVAWYERQELRWGGATVTCWFLDEETGRRQGFHQVPAGSPARNLRHWFRQEAERRYGVRISR